MIIKLSTIPAIHLLLLVPATVIIIVVRHWNGRMPIHGRGLVFSMAVMPSVAMIGSAGIPGSGHTLPGAMQCGWCSDTQVIIIRHNIRILISRLIFGNNWIKRRLTLLILLI